MSDPLAIAAADRHLATAMAELTTALEQLGIHQWHELVEGSALQDAIVEGQDAMLSLERAQGHASKALSDIDHALEMRLEPVTLYDWMVRAAE